MVPFASGRPTSFKVRKSLQSRWTVSSKRQHHLRKTSPQTTQSIASKALQAEIALKESKLRESMELNEAFIPPEQSIREIIRQEIHRANDVQPVASDRQRKVSFSSNPGRQSRSKRKPRRQGSSKSPQFKVVPNRRVQIRLNGSIVLARRQKKVSAPQNRQSFSRGKTAFQISNTTPVRPSSKELGNPQLFSFYVDIYTGHLSCIVKLPDEVCVGHTKRVGENKSFYNCKSSQTCCSLVLSKKITLVSRLQLSTPQTVKSVKYHLNFLFNPSSLTSFYQYYFPLDFNIVCYENKKRCKHHFKGNSRLKLSFNFSCLPVNKHI